MPFGLKNALAVFQLLIKMLVSCSKLTAVYINNILIFSSSWSKHLIHVRKVLTALRQAGLTAKPSKCKWEKSHLDYIGHRVGSRKFAVPEQRV